MTELSWEMIKEGTTNASLGILQLAQQEANFYGKDKIEMIDLFLALMRKGFYFGELDIQTVRGNLGPPEKQNEENKELGLSPTVLQVYTVAFNKKDEFYLAKADLNMLILSFLSLNVGTHLKLFKQFNINKDVLIDYYQKQTISRLMNQSQEPLEKIDLMRLFFEMEFKSIHKKLDNLIKIQTQQQY